MTEVAAWAITAFLILYFASQKLFAKTPAPPTAPEKESVPFDSLFETYSTRFGVPKRLMAAIVNVESDFNPQAVNREAKADARLGRDVDSLGLGQILYPDTAKGLDPNIERQDLFDPEINLSLMARLLARLLRSWPTKDADGFPAKAVASYNAGSPKYGKSGGFVNQEYVDEVKDAWRVYANV